MESKSEVNRRQNIGLSVVRNNRTNKAKVSIVRIDDYNFVRVHNAIQSCLDLIGGLESVVRPGNQVFVKINHLSPPSPPERGIVTHPVVLRSILELLNEIGATITVGDDIDCDGVDGFQVSGIRPICQKAKVKLINLRENGFVETKCNGLLLDKVYLSQIAINADVIINLPKFKTHSLTVFTGGVKNMYGIIPKGYRTRFHYEYLKTEDFSQMLTDIFSTVTPQLTVMDGIIAMEGEGPSSGNLRNLGVVLASQDAVAVDAVATKIAGLDPMSVYTTKYADERGIGVGNIQNIEVIGENIENIIVSDFKLPARYTSMVVGHVPEFLSNFLLAQMSVKPIVIEHLCTGCLECAKICPVSAISIDKNKLRLDKNTCIECMCCHEVCRFNAIVPTRPLPGRLLAYLAKLFRK